MYFSFISSLIVAKNGIPTFFFILYRRTVVRLRDKPNFLGMMGPHDLC